MGSLRVVNDDLIQPARGFGTHGHRDMEIITYVLKGGLTHQDSMGTEETLGRGSIQYMTAGTGVMHSEKNLSSNQELRLIQSWILPKSKGLNPRYRRCIPTWIAFISATPRNIPLERRLPARHVWHPIFIMGSSVSD